ncbi:MAG: ABC transporter permease [Actinobacteria bacterium]|uniref:Transport permease protein n=1 Tax=Nostocoides veronense TaxID=330836 RepID=A0ABN2LTY4_9MICO|nr:ABC transporter permease [Actinomycetota bacterium]
MTELADLHRLARSGTAPSPQDLAHRVRRRGILLYVETWLIASKTWAASLAIVGIVEPIAYLVALGWGLGTLVDDGGRSPGGVPYLMYVGPGLIVATAVMAAHQESTYPIMAGFKWRRLFHGPRATPLTPTQIGLGQIGGTLMRLLGQTSLFWLVLVAFGATRSAWSVLIVPIAALAGLAFGACVTAYAAGLENEGHQFASLQRFVVMPMFLFAGTFFPLSELPGYLHWIGWLSPIWHGTELARAASYGAHLAPSSVALHLSVLLAYAALGLVVSARRFERRLTR